MQADLDRPDQLRYWIEQLRRYRQLPPARLIALSFALAILLGAILLALPFAHAPGEQVTLLDAFFTATSAVCVTGLIVVDTSSAYSRFGQLVILLLVQAGGLGITTLGTIIALASGRRISFRHRMQIQAQLNGLEVGSVVKLIWRIVLLTFAVELIGAILLYLRFSQDMDRGTSIFQSLFHSISAFNNAGFALYSNSLSPFVNDIYVNTVIIALIIIGGLGFLVLFNLFVLTGRYGGQRRQLTFHSKIVLTTTALLIALGAFVVLFFEWRNPTTLGQLPLADKLMAGLFQSVTTRTAGFNTVDYGELRGATLIFTVLLMFVGGSPGSTAGGIKTVTFAVLIISAWHVSRGRTHHELSAFNRRISIEIVLKASMIALIGIMFSGCAVTLLAITESSMPIFPLVFEVVSAVSTVGLSMGITSELSIAGKLLIILLMYVGRLGPMSVAIALIEKPTEKRLTYPTENLIIG